MAQTKIRKGQLVTGRFIIEDINLTGGSQASFDFQNIDNNYKSLQIELSGRLDGSLTQDEVRLRANNDSGSNYDGMYARHNHSASLATSESLAATSALLGLVSANTAPSNDFSRCTIFIHNYSSSNMNKEFMLDGVIRASAVAGGIYVIKGFGNWRSTSVITRVTILPGPSSTNWMQYSRATLYGIL